MTNLKYAQQLTDLTGWKPDASFSRYSLEFLFKKIPTHIKYHDEYVYLKLYFSTSNGWSIAYGGSSSANQVLRASSLQSIGDAVTKILIAVITEGYYDV